MDAEKLLTTAELAAHFSVHIATIKGWAQTGKIRGYKAGDSKDSGEWRFNLAEVLDDLRNENPPTLENLNK